MPEIPDIEEALKTHNLTREEDAIFRSDAETKRVHQRVQAVAGLEADLAPDRRDAHGIAVARDAGRDSREDRPVLLDG